MRPGGTVLALDLATLTGFVHGVPGSTPKTGHVKFKGSTDAEIGKSCLTWAHEVFLVLKPSVLVIEEPKLIQNRRRPTNKATLKRLWGLSMIVQAVAAAHNITDIRICTADEARKHFLGTSRLTGEVAKKQVQARCKQLGWEFQTADEADGCAVWAWGCEKVQPGSGEPAIPELLPIPEHKLTPSLKRRGAKAPERMSAKEAAQLLFREPARAAGGRPSAKRRK